MARWLSAGCPTTRTQGGSDGPRRTRLPQEALKGCPYGRKTDRSYLKERGADVRRFIGQAVGPFLLPCHTFADKENWPLDVARPQCVGAAMFRDAIGVGDKMPAQLTRAKFDPEHVFGTLAEYLAYHDGCSVESAQRKIDRGLVAECFRLEYLRAMSANRKVKG